MFDFAKHKYSVIALVLLLASSLVWAQTRTQKPPQDEFEADSRQILRDRQLAEKEAQQDLAEAGRKFDPNAQAFEAPGTTGLKFVHVSSAPFTANSSIRGMVWSELKAWLSRTSPVVSTVAVYDGKQRRLTRYDLANYLKVDPGYIADPVLMNGGKTILMKCGRFSEDETYSLYGFDPQTKRLFRISKKEDRILWYSALSVSPDKRYIAYLSGAPIGNSPGSTLWVWDSHSGKSQKIAFHIELSGTLLWTQTNDLFYADMEVKEGVKQPVTYRWIAGKAPSLYKSDATSLTLSPNGKQVVYATSSDVKKDFDIQNSQYVLSNVDAKNRKVLSRNALGRYHPARQLLWSPDSNTVFSVINEGTESGQRVFAFDVAEEKSIFWPVVKPASFAKLLKVSTNGKQVVLFQQIPLGENKLGEEDYSFDIDLIDMITGKMRHLYSKQHILSLSESSIILNASSVFQTQN